MTQETFKHFNKLKMYFEWLRFNYRTKGILNTLDGTWIVKKKVPSLWYFGKSEALRSLNVNIFTALSMVVLFNGFSFWSGTVNLISSKPLLTSKPSKLMVFSLQTKPVSLNTRAKCHKKPYNKKNHGLRSELHRVIYWPLRGFWLIDLWFIKCSSLCILLGGTIENTDRAQKGKDATFLPIISSRKNPQ